MSRHLYLDVEPPVYTGPRDRLDKDAFQKHLSVVAARVRPEKVGTFLKAAPLKEALLDLPKIRTVVPDDDGTNRLVLLRMGKESEIPAGALEFIRKEGSGFTNYDIDLKYDYWTAEEILHAFLPEELREGAPTGFAMVGHIAHLNLNSEYLPYKHIIGQLILDKNNRVETVVNKLNNINAQFRFFDMELLAGKPEYIVEHHESDCRFTFDFTKVYWNSRLHTEHERLVQTFMPEEVVADVMAGVGPFAVPAAKKGCAVLANDLNPESAKYLSINVTNNRVTDLVRVFCEDGREFIQKSIERVWNGPFDPYTGPKLSRVQEEKERKRIQKLQAEGKPVPAPTKAEVDPAHVRRRVSHFVMNLPDSAITFLDAFRGIIPEGDSELRKAYELMPMIHCHCFTRELEQDKAEADIRGRVEEKIGCSLTDEVSYHHVRSVAPSKEMYCISFRLPAEAAVRKA
ncbi:hypothetical protein DFP72DRAFT_985672 [Ephemerocybe angulata]|uniref:tRNA (guanine(37)-N1)-methyltransferase n=1 Tax=Ephemerocybe angulata TaxID=980116 RepID=A0A8H6IKX7_9AGAR|nr:hypothetical protein DFP72DRAFT_985672 [Tulosesus angulatus]